MPQYPAATATLSTPEGFSKHVGVPTKSGQWLSGLLAIGLALLVWNIVSATRSMLQNSDSWSTWFDYFTSTQSETGSLNPFLFLMVWGPLVLVPVCLILMLTHWGSKGGVSDKMYAAYLERGFVSAPVALPIPYAIGNNQMRLGMIAAPNVPDDQVAQAVAQIADEYEAMDKGARRKLSRYLGKIAAAGKAFVDPELLAMPAGMFFVGLAPNQVKQNPIPLRVVVVNPDGASGAVYSTRNLPAA